jgi:hypothetical protein
MRVTIFAIGSRGDAQPILALALGLQRTGRRRASRRRRYGCRSLAGRQAGGLHPLHGGLALLVSQAPRVGRQPAAHPKETTRRCQACRRLDGRDDQQGDRHARQGTRRDDSQRKRRRKRRGPDRGPAPMPAWYNLARAEVMSAAGHGRKLPTAAMSGCTTWRRSPFLLRCKRPTSS